MMDKSRDIEFCVKLSQFMSGMMKVHIDAMYCMMKYCVATPNYGLLLKPEGKGMKLMQITNSN